MKIINLRLHYPHCQQDNLVEVIEEVFDVLAVINLRKHYYPLYTKDTFIEVPDEVAAVMEECRLYENRQEGQKSYYHVWAADDRAKEKPKKGIPDYSYKEGESL